MTRALQAASDGSTILLADEASQRHGAAASIDKYSDTRLWCGAFPREQRTSRHRHIGGANANRGNTLPHEIEEPVLNSGRAKFILNNEHSGAAVRGVGAILP